MFMIVNLVFLAFGFLSGNVFLTAPFPDRCLLVPFNAFQKNLKIKDKTSIIRDPGLSLNSEKLTTEAQHKKTNSMHRPNKRHRSDV